MCVNCGDKSQYLREIAAELNVGSESLAFVDDNPIERQQIRTQVPEVLVIELPHDPIEFARAIRECPRFERLSLLSEDRQRSEYYQNERERGRLEQTVSSREEFYRSLHQAVQIAPLNKSTLPRIAQLTTK